MMKLGFHIVIVTTLLAASLTPSAAATETPAEEARRHYGEGRRLFDEGLYDDAIAELQRAYDLDPNPALTYNIARAYQEDFRLEEALKLFQRFSDEAPSERAQAAAKTQMDKIHALKKKLRMYGAVTGFPAGRYERVTVDGELLVFDKEERFVVLPPGRHEIEYSYVGGLKMFVLERLPLGGVIDLRELALSHAVLEVAVSPEGARLYVDGELTVPDLPFTVEAGAHTVTVEAEGYQKIVKDISLDPEKRTALRIDMISYAQLDALHETGLPAYPLWIGAGAAVASLATGITLQAMAASERNHILDGKTTDKGYISEFTQIEARAAEDRASRYETGAWVGYGLLGAAAAFEISWLVVYLLDERGQDDASLTPALTVSPGHVGVQWRF